MQVSRTFLMFFGKNFGKAEEAMKRYTSLFENSGIEKIEYFKKGEAGGKEGTVKAARFTIAGQGFMAHDSLVEHNFDFTPSMSIFVSFDKESEIDEVYAELKKEGLELMPLGNYGFSKKFCWINDSYGVSWQLNLE